MIVEVRHVVLLFFALDYHVICVNFHCVSNFFFEDSFDKSLGCCPRIFQSKGHNLVTISTSIDDKGCRFHV